MWKVNAGRRSLLANEFLSRGIVAIGWREAGDYTSIESWDSLFAELARAYPDWTERQVQVGAGQIWRFLTELRKGDMVITYDPVERLYHVGSVSGDPIYAPDQVEELPVQRSVQWTASVSRDSLSNHARGRLGAILTLFKVEGATAKEIETLASGGTLNAPSNAVGADKSPNAVADDPYEGIEDQALERIKDRILGLGWEEMQELVAALLRSLGYRTIVSPAGPDRGKDILASRDGFGFEPPRVVVEVKHRRGPMGAPEIRSFLGGRHSEDRGLYVSTGGFSREAHFEAERASTVTHLMTLDGLARALIDNYEGLDERGRSLLPMKRIYWPL